jgi:carboxyl-terminal processing protease
MRGLILDVRFNPGGLLESAQQVSSLFLLPDQLICYTEGRDPKRRKYYYAQPGPLRLPEVPLVVLINGSSASASEIVAGCLHDHGRATLIGEKTFGKGTVQEPLPLVSGSVLHLTVARYYTPSKQVIHGRGIEPDLAVSVAEDKEHQFYRADGGGPDTAQRDAQLRRALQFLHERQTPAAPAAP